MEITTRVQSGCLWISYLPALARHFGWRNVRTCIIVANLEGETICPSLHPDAGEGC